MPPVVSIYGLMGPLAKAGGPPGLSRAADREGRPGLFLLDGEPGRRERRADLLASEVALANHEAAPEDQPIERHVAGGQRAGRVEVGIDDHAPALARELVGGVPPLIEPVAAGDVEDQQGSGPRPQRARGRTG